MSLYVRLVNVARGKGFTKKASSVSDDAPYPYKQSCFLIRSAPRPSTHILHLSLRTTSPISHHCTLKYLHYSRLYSLTLIPMSSSSPRLVQAIINNERARLPKAIKQVTKLILRRWSKRRIHKYKQRLVIPQLEQATQHG